MKTVGIGEYAITQDRNESIITYALGSCVAFILYCPVSQNAAMAHIVLPDIERRDQYNYLKNQPAYFANLIVPKMLDTFLLKNGCRKNMIQITVVGGAQSNWEQDCFQVGKKNIEMILLILQKYNMKPQKVDVGGTISRAVVISASNGEVVIKSRKIGI